MSKKNMDDSKVLHLLLAEYGFKYMIPLEDLAEPILGLSKNTAKRKAKSFALPFPAVKLNSSQKAPYMVNVYDLALFIEKRCSRARIEWNSVKS